MRQTVARKRNGPKAKAYRFDAGLNEEPKVLIQKAADLEGRTMTVLSLTALKQRLGGR